MVCQWRKRLHEHEGATALACGARRNRDCCMDGGQPARENDILNLKREVQADARQNRLRMTEAEAVTGNLEQTWDASTVGSIGRQAADGQCCDTKRSYRRELGAQWQRTKFRRTRTSWHASIERSNTTRTAGSEQVKRES